MASKINPKGILKSNSRSKGPNPKGINPGGINNKPAAKPVVKPIVSSTKLKSADPRTMGQIVKGQGYKAPTRTNTPVVKPAAKKTVKPVASKPVTSTTTPRTRGGVSKGNTPGVGSKRKALADIKARANERLATEKAAAEKAPKANLKRTPRVTAVQRSGKPAPGPKAGRRIVRAEAAAKALKSAKLAKAGKVGAGVAIAAGLIYGGKKLYDSSKSKEDKAKKDTKKSERTDTLIKTPSLKDELKKRGVDTAKPGDTLKYVIDAPKSKKDDSKKGSLPKATTPAVKKAEPVGKLETKPAQEIPNKIVDEARTSIPSKTTTATPATTTSSTSTTSSNATNLQPRATLINKIRGAVNTGRERRAEKASARGNEAKAERLKDKISDTEKKMMMRKGGAVKSKTKKK